MRRLKAEAGSRVTAGILTGGGSRRFGRDKAFYPWKGRTLLEWTIRGAGLISDNLYILAKETQLPGDYPEGVQILKDRFAVSTPLNGIHSVIPYVEEWLLLLACDIPFFDETILSLLWEHRSSEKAVVIRESGRYQPFLGLYPKSVLSYWEDAFERGEYHLQRIVERMPRIVLDEEYMESRKVNRAGFTNINCPADLERLVL